MKPDIKVVTQKPFVICILAILCCLLWGSSFPVIKICYNLFNISANQTSSIILFAGLRFTLAGILSITGLSIASKKIMHPDKTNIKSIGLLSLTQTIGQYILSYIGLAHATGVSSSVIKSLNVFIVIIISSLIFKQEKLTGKKILGCVIGFIGILVMNVFKTDMSINFSFYGEGFIFLSTIASAFASSLSKKYSQNQNPVLLSGWQFFIGGLVLTAVGFLSGGRLQTVSLNGILMIIYLAMVSALAFAIWTTLLKYNSMSKVTVYNFMYPVFGVILSALLLNEKDSLNISCVFALILVSIGIYIVNKAKAKG